MLKKQIRSEIISYGGRHRLYLNTTDEAVLYALNYSKKQFIKKIKKGFLAAGFLFAVSLITVGMYYQEPSSIYFSPFSLIGAVGYLFYINKNVNIRKSILNNGKTDEEISLERFKSAHERLLMKQLNPSPEEVIEAQNARESILSDAQRIISYRKLVEQNPEMYVLKYKSYNLNIIPNIETLEPIAASLKCPITQEYIQDPVLAPDQVLYERYALQQYYLNGGRKCPVNRTIDLPDPATMCSDLVTSKLIRKIYKKHKKATHVNIDNDVASNISL